MEWISENWVFLVVAIAFVAMHAFGHGGHGGHRPGRSDRNGADRRTGDASGTRGGHRH